MHYHYLTLEQRNNLESILRAQLASGALNTALGLLRQGDYGVCIECGADIPYARLRDDPLALHCRACARPPRAANGEH
jgi:RNA polymerase-binding transcription factor DksA